MGSLSPTARTHVRAMMLSMIGLIVLVLVGVGVYALVVGLDRVQPARVEAVAVSDDDRDLLVRYTGGGPGCGDPGDVAVTETADDVEVAATVVVPRATRLGFACEDLGVAMYQSVRLDRPLGDRVVRDAYSGGGGEVEVLESVAELVVE